MTTTKNGEQTYKWGWILSVIALGNSVSTELVRDWDEVRGPLGIVLAVMVMATSLVTGIAAAAVRPWSWSVLLASQVLALVWSVLYMTLIAPLWIDRVLVGVVMPAYSAVSFAYFYKRRALFRARWRWGWLERSWPRLIGPETLGPEARSGFSGLSPVKRSLFVVVVGLWILLVQISAR